MAVMVTVVSIAIIALVSLLIAVAVTVADEPGTCRQKSTRICELLGLPFRLALLPLVLVRGRAPCEKTVRKLGAGPKAVAARQKAESEGLDTVAAWAAETPLTLGLVVLEDMWLRGRSTEWFFRTGDDRYKIRCMMSLTAYFGADPRHMADTVEGILTAGDRACSLINFSHDFVYAREVVAYYRGEAGDPRGPGTGEPRKLFRGGAVTLTWDQVRSGQARELVEEPGPSTRHDPPTHRYLREPASVSVADLRREHGMVFRIELPVTYYFTVRK